MTTCCSQSNPIPVPSNGSPENIFRTKKVAEGYVAAPDSPMQQPQATEMSNQPSSEANLDKNGLSQSMKGSDHVLSRFVHHYLLVNDLRHIEVALMKKSM